MKTIVFNIPKDAAQYFDLQDQKNDELAECNKDLLECLNQNDQLPGSLPETGN